MKYHCYICGKEITEENKTDEHIILNAIGGHLHSDTILKIATRRWATMRTLN